MPELCVYGAVNVALHRFSSALLIWTWWLGIPINRDSADSIRYFLLVLFLPRTYIWLLCRYYARFFFFNWLLVHGFSRPGGLLKFTTKHVKDIYITRYFLSFPEMIVPYRRTTSIQNLLNMITGSAYWNISHLSAVEKTIVQNSTSMSSHHSPKRHHIPRFLIYRGDSTRNKSITVLDRTPRLPLPITASALECLVALQSKRRYLWIDLIYINQSDEDEKTKQDGIMRDIYNTAVEVVAVLGNSAIAWASPTLDHDTSEILRHTCRHYRSVAESLLRECMLRGDDHFGHDPRCYDFQLNMLFNNHYPLKS